MLTTTLFGRVIHSEQLHTVVAVDTVMNSLSRIQIQLDDTQGALDVHDDGWSSVSPSTVCSVVTTTTTALTPQKFLGDTASSITAATSTDDDIAVHVAHVLGHAMVAQAPEGSNPQTVKYANLLSDLTTITGNLLSSGCTSGDELMLACAIILRSARSSENPNGLVLAHANLRRVLVAAIRLVAKAHSDEYFSIGTMCAAANHKTLPHASSDFLAMMATCEWKLFEALGMNCSVSMDEFNALRMA